jgi:quinol monooxygenase YgiN
MKVGLLVHIKAKPEHADEVAAMLRGAQELAMQEQGTVAWFAFRESATTFGVFDAFENEQGRQAHLAGRIAAALGEAAQTMLCEPPVIAQVDLLGVKVPGHHNASATA